MISPIFGKLGLDCFIHGFEAWGALAITEKSELAPRQRPWRAFARWELQPSPPRVSLEERLGKPGSPLAKTDAPRAVSWRVFQSSRPKALNLKTPSGALKRAARGRVIREIERRRTA
jgi:hypothetical protein